MQLIGLSFLLTWPLDTQILKSCNKHLELGNCDLNPWVRPGSLLEIWNLEIVFWNPDLDLGWTLETWKLQLETLTWINRDSLSLFTTTMQFEIRCLFSMCDIFRKGGHRTMVNIRLIATWKYWLSDQYPSNTWTQIWKSWNFETLQLWKQEATNRPNEETTIHQPKPRNPKPFSVQLRESPPPLYHPTLPTPPHPELRIEE